MSCLIADIVQHFVDSKLEFDAGYVYQDVNRAIQYVNQSGLVHRGILSDPSRYAVKNLNMRKKISVSAFMLSKDAEGKWEEVLLTNSPYYFVDCILESFQMDFAKLWSGPSVKELQQQSY